MKVINVEIWKPNGGIYSLYDYNDFPDTIDLEKVYLQGRFDAVPFVVDTREQLEALIYGE